MILNAPCSSTITDFLTTAAARLASTGIENPDREARIILSHVRACDRAALIADRDTRLTPEEHAQACAYLARRMQREPWARIIGCREFYGLPFFLNAQTLEPRPDSETLVDVVLDEMLRSSCDTAQPARILDWGTGTGCLLLALLHARPASLGWGLDCAEGAVWQAQENAQRLGLAERATFATADWHKGWEGMPEPFRHGAPFDAVISNPPYVTPHDHATLMPEVRTHDPPLALLGGADGLAAYRVLAPLAHALLKEGGLCVFEVGDGQHGDVAGLLAHCGFTPCGFRNDYGGVTRVVFARKT